MNYNINSIETLKKNPYLLTSPKMTLDTLKRVFYATVKMSEDGTPYTEAERHIIASIFENSLVTDEMRLAFIRTLPRNEMFLDEVWDLLDPATEYDATGAFNDGSEQTRLSYCVLSAMRDRCFMVDSPAVTEQFNKAMEQALHRDAELAGLQELPVAFLERTLAGRR